MLQNYKPTTTHIRKYMEEQIFYAPPASKIWNLNQLFKSLNDKKYMNF